MLRAVVQQVHADADVDAHCLEGLLAGLAVDNVVSEVKFVLDGSDGGRGKEFGEPFVRGLAGGTAVDVRFGRDGMVVGVCCEGREGLG